MYSVLGLTFRVLKLRSKQKAGVHMLMIIGHYYNYLVSFLLLHDYMHYCNSFSVLNSFILIGLYNSLYVTTN